MYTCSMVFVGDQQVGVDHLPSAKPPGAVPPSDDKERSVQSCSGDARSCCAHASHLQIAVQCFLSSLLLAVLKLYCNSHLLPSACPWVEPLDRAQLVSSVEAAHHVDLPSKRHSCCVRPWLFLNEDRQRNEARTGVTKGLPILHWLVSTSYTSTEPSLSTVLSGARPPIAKIFPLRAANAGKLRPCLMEESRRTWIFV